MSKLFDGMTCVLSGTLSLPHLELGALITSNGGIVASNVSSQTTHLISTPLDVQKGSVKTTRAKQLNLPIIAESFIHNSLKEQKRETEATHIITAEMIALAESQAGTEAGTLNGAPAPPRRGRGAKKKEPQLITGPVHSIYKVDIKRLQQDVVPSPEFAKLWQEMTKLDVPVNNKTKITAHIDQELPPPSGSVSEVSNTTVNEEADQIPGKRIIRTEIEGGIWAILNKIKFTTYRMDPEEDDGIWKRNGDVRLTFVNLQTPNRFVHVYARERFDITENIDFQGRLLVEVLMADVNEAAEKWVSYVVRPQTSGWNCSGCVCYPFFYSREDLELANGAYGFSKNSKAFSEAGVFLQLQGITFSHCLKKALSTLVQPELIHREDEYHLWSGGGGDEEDDDDDEEEDDGDIESWELSDDDEPPRKRKKNEDRGWKSDEDDDEEEEEEDDDDDDDY